MFGKRGPLAPNFGTSRTEQQKREASDRKRLFWASKTPEERRAFAMKMVAARQAHRTA